MTSTGTATASRATRRTRALRNDGPRRGAHSADRADCVALAPSAAVASRKPTATERAALAQAMEAPARCLAIRVATVRRGWASAKFRRFKGKCAKYASDGVTVWRRRDGVWRHGFAGSSWSCPIAKVPEVVRSDLNLPCPEGGL